MVCALGEAEAAAAALNAAGHTDAVLTPDGDALIFGARTVYRDFHVTVYLAFSLFCVIGANCCGFTMRTVL